MKQELYLGLGTNRRGSRAIVLIKIWWFGR